MSSSDDLYAVLGVSRTATSKEIKGAYRELAARFHPDKHAGNPLEELAEAKLTQLNDAYAVLSDASRRARYDAGLSSDHGPPRGSPFPGSTKLWQTVCGIALLLLLIRFGPVFLRLPRAYLWVLGVVLMASVAYFGIRWIRGRKR